MKRFWLWFITSHVDVTERDGKNHYRYQPAPVQWALFIYGLTFALYMAWQLFFRA